MKWYKVYLWVTDREFDAMQDAIYEHDIDWQFLDRDGDYARIAFYADTREQLTAFLAEIGKGDAKIVEEED